nr:MAG TPA: hypothetical protein [Bacteriophage sp.]
MKLLAEFLQEQLGEDKIEAIFTLKEYMKYTNVKNQSDEEVFQELKDKVERLINYTVSMGDGDINQSFVCTNIVVSILWTGKKFMIKFADETITLRKLNENWLVSCVTKGDK